MRFAAAGNALAHLRARRQHGHALSIVQAIHQAQCLLFRLIQAAFTICLRLHAGGQVKYQHRFARHTAADGRAHQSGRQQKRQQQLQKIQDILFQFLKWARRGLIRRGLLPQQQARRGLLHALALEQIQSGNDRQAQQRPCARGI